MNDEIEDVIAGLELDLNYHRQFGFPQTAERLEKAIAALRRSQPEGEMPKEGTPLTDKHLEHLNLPDGNKVGIPIETVALLRKLERELAQSQAECNTHYGRLAGLLFSGALDKYTGADIQSWAKEYSDKLSQSQARCAEHEKDAARYRWLKHFSADDYAIEVRALDGFEGRLVFAASPRLLDDTIDAALSRKD